VNEQSRQPAGATAAIDKSDVDAIAVKMIHAVAAGPEENLCPLPSSFHQRYGAIERHLPQKGIAWPEL
jgi:hypothetical protein